jgi:bacterial/archaeal transporter family-2 protein
MSYNILIYALLAAFAGACIALQATANSGFRKNIDSPWFAAFFSICGTILSATLFMLIYRPTTPSWDQLKSTSWWNWIGGPLGAMIVLAGAALVQRLGAAPFIALVVAGQLICSLLLDHFALMNLQENPITLGRIFGAVLVVTGVLCIKYL